MITGFNTDIEHDGVIYHVQTEDKGLDSPLILSLVYSGGAILASKRSPYKDLIASGFDEEELTLRLKRQHRLICAAINAGRLEELKRMGRGDEKIETALSDLPLPVVEDFVVEQGWPTTPAVIEEIDVEPAPPVTPPPVTAPPVVHASTPEPPVPSSEVPDIKSLLVSTADDYAALAEANPPPPPPPAAPLPPPEEVSPRPRGTRPSAYTVHDSRRQMRIRNAGKVEKGLVITILDEEEFRAGQIFNIRVLVENRTEVTGKPLSGASLSVKILGTAFRPQLYSVKTGRDGVAVVSAQIPLFTSGRAAILITAEAEGKTVETRRIIHSAL
ncbi:MAG: hypothetical protein AABN95_04590 [Acidobacteriota bacterium]